MQPPSFDDFMKEKEVEGGLVGDRTEPLKFKSCPTPGCGCKVIHAVHEDGVLQGFECEEGCSYIVKRNAFTGELIYFILTAFTKSRFSDPDNLRGLKINPIGEPYTDWY